MRHRFHALCPYFAMFPERFVEKHLIYSRPDELVFDPFSGRGTTGFQALLAGRKAISSDLSPVAVCISKAKMSPPTLEQVSTRLRELESSFEPIVDPVDDDEFYTACFAERTLRQLIFLRTKLDWRGSDVDAFIAAMVLGVLHGESHRSPKYLSNRMPRTIATKPNYSVQWWTRYGYIAPERDVFNILHLEARYRFDTGRPSQSGEVAEIDARNADAHFSKHHGQVSLVITSPPYLDTTHFMEDQWLRVWFLGGKSRPGGSKRGDDRHTSATQYWKFLEEVWQGMQHLLRPKEATVVVRIGGSRLEFEDAKERLVEALARGLGREVSIHSATQSDIVGGQLRSFRPNAKGTKHEFDFVFKAH